MTPEQRLAAAVIMAACQDLFTKTIPGAYDETATELLRLEAMLFLCSSKGEWARSRETYCDLCDLNPDLLRESIFAILDGRDPKQKGEQVSLRFTGVAEARALWMKESARRKSHLDVLRERVKARRERRLAVQLAEQDRVLKEKRNPSKTAVVNCLADYFDDLDLAS